MSVRRDIHFDTIRRALNIDEDSHDERRKIAKARIAQNPVHIIPSWVNDKNINDLSHIFIERAKMVQTDIVEVAQLNDALAPICAYLNDKDYPLELWYGGDKTINQLHFKDYECELTASQDLTGKKSYITRALAGIAETGTILLQSNENDWTTGNFLPECHIVLLERSTIYSTYEQAWQRVDMKKLPRAVNLITGPSRTGDIAQKLELGAHGPINLLVVIYG